MSENNDALFHKLNDLINGQEPPDQGTSRKINLMVLQALYQKSLMLEESQKAMGASITNLIADVGSISKMLIEYPSITWLLRHKTKQTISVIAFVFILLSMFYVSDTRAWILHFMGLDFIVSPPP